MRRLGSGVFLGLDRVHLLGPDHATSLRDVVRHPGGVGILPIDGDDVWLIQQFRVAAGRRVLEIPAGKLDQSFESVEQAAERELSEELGISAVELIRIGQLLPSPGYTDELIYLYAANGIVPGERRPDGAEERDAKVVRLPFSRGLELLEQGEIDDAKTQIALLLWARRRG